MSKINKPIVMKFKSRTNILMNKEKINYRWITERVQTIAIKVTIQIKIIMIQIKELTQIKVIKNRIAMMNYLKINKFNLTYHLKEA